MNRPHLRSALEKRARMRLISGQFRKQRKKVAAPLRRGVFMVPATITSIGLLAGFYSLISSVDAHFEFAAVLIMVAFVCDGLDGRVARLSRTSSQFGVEYDSLSDIVAFGVAPAGLAYSWALRPLGAVAIVISGLFVVAAGLRLARFNIQTGTTDKRRFTGLPVPGAAAMIAGIVLAYSYFELNSPRALCVVMAPLTFALAALMISRVPYPSFKVLHFRKRVQIELMAGVLVVVAMLLAMPQFTVFMLATAYVLSGPFLIVRGEGMTAKVPVLHPVATDAGYSQPTPDSHETTP
jgi:CDP-diacylglycerol---serine O-phosphatidyltransferase